jgi:hypothetical protein
VRFEQIPCFPHVTWWVGPKPFTRGASSPAPLPFFHPAPAVSPPPFPLFASTTYTPSRRWKLGIHPIPGRIATSTICFDLFIVNGYPHTLRELNSQTGLFSSLIIYAQHVKLGASLQRNLSTYHSLKLSQRHPPHHHGSRYQLQQQAPCRGPGHRKVLLLDSRTSQRNRQGLQDRIRGWSPELWTGHCHDSQLLFERT